MKLYYIFENDENIYRIGYVCRQEYWFNYDFAKT